MLVQVVVSIKQLPKFMIFREVFIDKVKKTFPTLVATNISLACIQECSHYCFIEPYNISLSLPIIIILRY